MSVGVAPEIDTIEVGEATIATIGLTEILRGDMPRIGVAKQREILGMGKRIDDAARMFVYDEFPGRLSMPRPFTYRKLLEQFTKPLPAGAVDKLMKSFPPDASDIALSFISTLQNMYAHLAEMVPVASYDTYLGPKRIMPTSDKTFEFFNQYWVIDDPMATFQLMQRGALLPEQVNALKTFYPSLYNYMTAALLDALVARNLREPNFLNLPPRADRGLATFKQQRIVPYGPSIHVVPPHEPQPGAPAPSTSAQSKISKGLESKAQAVSGVT